MQRTLIHIEDLRVDCKIGVWTHERNTTQQLRVDLTVEFDAEASAVSDDLNQTLNYADLAREVTFILEEGQFLLLESAARMIARWALLDPISGTTRPAIERVDIKLTKFGALPGSTLASVQVGMSKAEISAPTINEPWGEHREIGRAGALTLSRLTVTPNAQVPPAALNCGRGAILFLSDGFISADAESAQIGSRRSWLDSHPSGYRNHRDTFASVLILTENIDS